jgi:hypothetical protein
MSDVINFDGHDFRTERKAVEAFEAAGGDMEEAVTVYLGLSSVLWCDKGSKRARIRAEKVIHRARKVIASIKQYDVVLVVKGGGEIPVCSCSSTKPWEYVAKKVVRLYGGTLKKLELPGYLIADRRGVGIPIPLEQLQGRTVK